MNATHAYASYRPCGHPIALMVDEPDHPKDVASFVAKEIRDGHRVERVTIPEARVIGVMYCQCVPSAAYAKVCAKRRRKR